MPELPEVEDAARRLRQAIAGKVLTRILLRHPAYRRRLSRTRIGRAIGHRVERIERRGKQQLIHLENGIVIVAHFRMTGDWESGHVSHPIHRFARALLVFDDGTRVSLVDPRALGTLEVAADETALRRPGVEPLSAEFTAEFLATAFARRRVAVKLALLDQNVVAGVGNIYAAESLWNARINPAIPARELTLPELRRLVRSIQRVLRRASFNPARFEETSNVRFNVYDREGRRCRRCAGTIRRIRQGARSTCFCPECQK